MNGRGQVVGSGREGTRTFAFLSEGSTIQELGFDTAVAINKRGVVLGYDRHPLSIQPLLWEGGVIRYLTGLSGYFLPRALNDRGDVVGEGGTHAVLWRDGVAHDLGFLEGCQYGTAGDINNRGQVIGFCVGDSTERGFLWQNGVMTDLGLPGYPYSDTAAINESGQIAGIYSRGGDEIGGFLWHEGVVTDLGQNAWPTAINDRGQIVGVRSGNAFVWEAGVMTDLGPGQAHDINKRGEIVGYVVTPGRGSHPVVWVPVAQRAGSRDDLNIESGREGD
jgi:probable HAF family extracellular repeat protein